MFSHRNTPLYLNSRSTTIWWVEVHPDYLGTMELWGILSNFSHVLDSNTSDLLLTAKSAWWSNGVDPVGTGAATTISMRLSFVWNQPELIKRGASCSHWCWLPPHSLWSFLLCESTMTNTYYWREITNPLMVTVVTCLIWWWRLWEAVDSPEEPGMSLWHTLSKSPWHQCKQSHNLQYPCEWYHSRTTL